MPNTLIRLLALAVLPLALGAPPALAAQPLGLGACLDLAYKTSSQVGQGADQAQVEQEKLATAKRRFLPKLELDLANQPKVDYYGRPVDDTDHYTNDVKLTQPLYTGGVLMGRYEQAQQGVKKIGLGEDKSRLEVALEVVPVYYQLLAARQVSQLGQDLVAKAGDLVAGARQGVKEGYQRLEDLLHAEARLLEVSYKVTESKSQAQAAAYQIKELIGYEREQSVALEPQAPEFNPPAGAEQVLDQTFKHNASLKAAQAEDLYQSLGLGVAESLDMPRFSLVGRYGTEGDDFPGPDKYAGVMLQCDISFGDSSAKLYADYEHQNENPSAFYFQDQDINRRGLHLAFLDGSSNAQSRAEARLSRRKARDEVRDLRAKLETKILSLWDELKRQNELLALAAKQADLNSERVSVVRARREAGAATPAEVLEREMDLAEARTKVIQATYERYRVLAMLCLLSGQPLVCKDVQ